MAICPLWGQTVYENHAQDYRIKQVDVSPTIGTRPTTNPTLVMESIPNETYTIPHDERSACCKPNVSDTLTHYVHYVSQPIPKVYDVNAAKELDMANTLDTSCRGVWGKQNGTVVYALEGNGSRESHHGPGFTDNDKMYTLNTAEHHAVAQPVSTTGGRVYTTSKASFMTNWTEDKAQTLVATDWKDAPVVVTENKPEEETFKKVLESLLFVDNYCHARDCVDCPFYRMSYEGDCPLDKLSSGEKVYMETVKDKAEKRIELYLKGKFDKEYWGSYWEE